MNDASGRLKRREFLGAAATGAVLLASRPAVAAAAKGKSTPTTPSAHKLPSASSALYVCEMCGHVEFRDPPEFCPVCHAEEQFNTKSSIFTDALAKWKDGEAKHTPVIRVQEKSALVSEVPCKEVYVRVGKTMHELEKANHIHFVDFYLDEMFFTRFFASPHMQPAVVFFVVGDAAKIRAVAYCSKHGFWKAEAPL
jgi:desulfoferrodoxin-like iron-binding protein